MEESKHISQYDADRETVGAIYRNAQIHGDKTPILNDDLTKVMASSLVEDLNECINQGTKDFENQPFYITVHEKKDMTMPRALLRRMIKTKYRPYPEDDTLVFYIDPPTNDVRFCWCLPHHTEMDNMIRNANLFDKDLVGTIKAWKAVDLSHFGFVKIGLGDEWAPNPHWEDKRLTSVQSARQNLILAA